MDGRACRGAIDDLSSWRGKIDPHDRDLRGYVDQSLGYLRLLHADPNRLQGTIGQDAVSRLERLEVELARRQGNSNNCRARGFGHRKTRRRSTAMPWLSTSGNSARRNTNT